MGNSKSKEVSQFITVSNIKGETLRTTDVKHMKMNLLRNNKKSEYFYTAQLNVSELFEYFNNYNRIKLIKGGQTVRQITNISINDDGKSNKSLAIDLTRDDGNLLIYVDTSMREIRTVNDDTDFTRLLADTFNIDYTKCITNDTKFNMFINV